jgi:hypothetical protein
MMGLIHNAFDLRQLRAEVSRILRPGGFFMAGSPGFARSRMRLAQAR